MRRNEREITDKNTIAGIIRLCSVCRIGLYDGKAPYIIPVNFHYSEDSSKRTVYFHSAGSGKKLDCIKAGSTAAVEWDIPGGVVIAEKPCDYGFEYVSVIASGKPFFVESEEEKARILAALTSRYIRTRENSGPRISIPTAAARSTVVVGIELDEVTGKASSGDYLAALLAGTRTAEGHE